MKQLPQIIFFVMVIICVGFCGVWIGQQTTLPSDYGNSGNMHALFHEKLNVSDAQEAKIVDIEKEFERLQILYNGQMKMANLELAQAIKEGGYESPDIENIVHKIHRAMGSLQALSLKHLADVGEILDPEQNQKLQEMVIEQLYRNAGE
ncbi:MAG: hypothetical protein COB14_04285 [Alphaproteobacteria bacterium]|nr:MAG: hypothetical protein COB14_04285 [Alphaproteobacteria bacterium]